MLKSDILNIMNPTIQLLKWSIMIFKPNIFIQIPTKHKNNRVMDNLIKENTRKKWVIGNLFIFMIKYQKEMINWKPFHLHDLCLNRWTICAKSLLSCTIELFQYLDQSETLSNDSFLYDVSAATLVFSSVY